MLMVLQRVLLFGKPQHEPAWGARTPIVAGGMAISMVFVPLSNMALGDILKTEVGNPSGIFNFLGNKRQCVRVVYSDWLLF